MKILIVTEHYWPEVGAASSRLANMAEGFKREGHEVDVLTTLPNYPEGHIFAGYKRRLWKRERHNGITLFRYWIYATLSHRPLDRVLNMFTFAFSLWLFCFHFRRALSYDRVIIQSPTLVTAASATVLFKKLFRKKCVLNVSDIWPLTAVDMGAIRESSMSHRFLSALEKFLYQSADGILGQSSEILEHVSSYPHNCPLFLYRNLQHYPEMATPKERHTPLRLVFSGMLGVAQNVAAIVRNVPFRQIGVELHILGGGKQLEEIKQYIEEHPHCGVYTHGFVPKEEVAGWLSQMDASIVPLTVRIHGAVPSKIYDILPQGLPILFCGGGEGARIIDNWQVGFVSEPGDYKALIRNLEHLRDMPADEFKALSSSCLKVSHNELNFDKQMKETVAFIASLERNIKLKWE